MEKPKIYTPKPDYEKRRLQVEQELCEKAYEQGKNGMKNNEEAWAMIDPMSLLIPIKAA